MSENRKAGERKEFEIYPGLVVAFRWCPATRSAEWKEISGGDDFFWMGSPEDEEGRIEDEQQHKVHLTKGFWMAETQCTQEQWERVMENNPSASENVAKKSPVDSVDWHAIQAFLEKLNPVSRLRAILPTEAQWEYACRAGAQSVFHYGCSLGSDEANFNGVFPYADEKKGVYRAITLAVSSFGANSWGLYDMHGNVWEWCHDLYNEYRYSSEVETDPEGSQCDQNLVRVLRGGGWNSDAVSCRSASRHWSRPSFSSDDYGFRLSLQV